MNNRDISSFWFNVQSCFKQGILNLLNNSILKINFIDRNNGLNLLLIYDLDNLPCLFFNPFSCSYNQNY